MEFAKATARALPEVVKEMLAEQTRMKGFQRAFPTNNPAINDFYSRFFESQRYYYSSSQSSS
jgi:hypothetical protein